MISPRWSVPDAAPAPVIWWCTCSAPAGPTAPRAGFVVSGKVGNAVVRHRVTRRLRPLVRRELAGLPAGTDVVVRALPRGRDRQQRRSGPGSAVRAGRGASASGPCAAVPLGARQVDADDVAARAKVLIAPIRFYQRFITPYTPATCRYYPTCSAYAVTALRTHGAVVGTGLTIWRLLRCNPWSSGGIDHVPAKGQLRHRHAERRTCSLPASSPRGLPANTLVSEPVGQRTRRFREFLHRRPRGTPLGRHRP